MVYYCKKKNKEKYVKDILPKDNDEMEALEEEHFNVHRRLYNQTEFSKSFPSNKFVSFSIILFLKNLFTKTCAPSKECAKKQLYNRVPAIKWIKNYINEFILPDFLAGITVIFLFLFAFLFVCVRVLFSSFRVLFCFWLCCFVFV